MLSGLLRLYFPLGTPVVVACLFMMQQLLIHDAAIAYS